jgi:hypothetical protein
MLYKPNFCCHCGEKIERLTWSPLTSRRFCELCETEKKPYDLLPRAIVVIGLVLGVFGLAGFFSDGNGSKMKSAKVEHSPSQKRGIKSPGTNVAAVNGKALNVDTTVLAPQLNANTHNSAGPTDENIKQRKDQAKTSTEAAYYCNAMTKKGTPCTRRVKTKGRCWQHVGQPAVDPS